MKEAQQVVTEKTSALEAEAYKTKRLQVNALLRKRFTCMDYSILQNRKFYIQNNLIYPVIIFI